MEDRSAENLLLNAARKCLGITPLERYEQQQLELQGLSSLVKKGMKSKSTKSAAPGSGGGGTSGRVGSSGGLNSNKTGTAPSSQGSQQASEGSGDSAAASAAGKEGGDASTAASSVDVEGTFMFSSDSRLSQGIMSFFSCSPLFLTTCVVELFPFAQLELRGSRELF